MSFWGARHHVTHFRPRVNPLEILLGVEAGSEAQWENLTCRLKAPADPQQERKIAVNKILIMAPSCHVWWHTPLVLALVRQRQVGPCEFKVSLHLQSDTLPQNKTRQNPNNNNNKKQTCKLNHMAQIREAQQGWGTAQQQSPWLACPWVSIQQHKINKIYTCNKPIIFLASVKVFYSFCNLITSAIGDERPKKRGKTKAELCNI